MPWFDDAAQYYRELPANDQPLSQGDIVVAATTVIQSDAASSDVPGPTTLDESRRTTIWLASDAHFPAAPTLSARTRWGLAMVIPHGCALDKDWNERISDLIEAGHGRDEAIRRASEDPTLDPYVTLAPVRALASVDINKRAGIRMNRRLGNFPVCASDSIPEAYVDLTRLSTVHYTTLPGSCRIASISDLALAHFHFALTMNFAYRGLSGLAQLEDAIGHKIVSVNAAPRSGGRLIATFILENGSELVLEGSDRNRPAELPSRQRRN
jgi:hypothetical protein